MVRCYGVFWDHGLTHRWSFIVRSYWCILGSRDNSEVELYGEVLRCILGSRDKSVVELYSEELLVYSGITG